MKINRKEFLTILENLKPGLANREIIEQSGKFVFNDNLIRTYNDEITVSYPFELDIAGAVPAKEFIEFIKKLPDKEIDISTDDNEIIIRGRKRKAGIKTEQEIKLPKLELDIKKWYKLPENFSDVLKFCRFSCSDNIEKPWMTCINVKDNYAYSCSHHRATRYKLNMKVQKELMIPADAAKSLIPYKPTKFNIENNWIHFSNETNSIFSCRTIMDKFKDINKLFDVPGKEVQIPKDFVSVIERSDVFQTDMDDKYVTILLSEKGIKCRGEGSIGWMEEVTMSDYKGPDLMFYVNPILFAEILHHLNTVIVGGRLLFKGDNFEHMIAICSEK